MFHISKESQQDLRVKTAEEGKRSKALQVGCVEKTLFLCIFDAATPSNTHLTLEVRHLTDETCASMTF